MEPPRQSCKEEEEEEEKHPALGHTALPVLTPQSCRTLPKVGLQVEDRTTYPAQPPPLPLPAGLGGLRATPCPMSSRHRGSQKGELADGSGANSAANSHQVRREKGCVEMLLPPQPRPFLKT